MFMCLLKGSCSKLLLNDDLLLLIDETSTRMKSTLLLTLLLPLSALAQPAIEGLGIFKLGKSTPDIVQQYAREKGAMLEKVSTINKLYTKRYNEITVKEVATNTGATDEEPSDGSYCPNVRTFYLSEYTIAEVKIESIFLVFYENVLSRIYTTNDYSINRPFTEKYGPGKQRLETVLTKCVDKSAKDGFRSDTRVITEWISPGVRAASFNGSTYDIRCKRYKGPSFIIERIDIANQMAACEQHGVLAAQKLVEGRKNDRLKDF